jgi:hypothetical protein
MMTLQDVLKVVDTLSPEELRELRAYLDNRAESPHVVLSPGERARRLEEGFQALREGLTPSQLDAMTDAMNAESVEPFDEDTWKD